MSDVKMLSLTQMEYKGFQGDINYDLATNTYSGKVTNRQTFYSIEYLAKTIHGLRDAFAKAFQKRNGNSRLNCSEAYYYVS